MSEPASQPPADSLPPPPPARSPLARAMLLAAALAWTLAVIVTCVRKYHAGLYTDFDLAIFSQATFGVLRGSGFGSIRGMYWLGDHSSLVLLLLAPLGWIVRTPLLLPLAQALALGAGTLPLFRYARRRLGDENAAAAFAVAWLLQPALGYLATFEFHPETFATPALLAVVAALAARRTRAALAFAAFAALAREDVALPLMVLGALAALRGPRPVRHAGLAIAGVAAASLLLSFAVLKPLLAHGEADYGAMYAAWGRGPAGILIGLARHPLEALRAFAGTPGNPADTAIKHEYWRRLLCPFALLPVLAPLSLLPALPVFAEHLLASRPEQHSIVFQYTALSLPFVALAAVDAAAVVARARGTRPGPLPARVLAALMLAAALLAQWRYGPWSAGAERSAFPPSERAWPTGRDEAVARWRTAFQHALPAHGELVVDFPSLAPLSMCDSIHSLHHVAAGHFTYSTRAYPAPQHPAGMLADLSALWAAGEIDSAGLERVCAYARTHGLRIVDAAGDLVRLAPTAGDTLAWLGTAPEAPGITKPHASPGAAPEALNITFNAALAYLGGTLPLPTVRPGDRLPVVTRWRRTGVLPGRAQMEWAVTDSAGRTREDEPRLLGAGWSDPAAWPAGESIEERTTWVVPTDLPAGDYVLAFSLSWRRGDTERPARTDDPRVRDAGGSVDVGTFRVRAR